MKITIQNKPKQTTPSKIVRKKKGSKSKRKTHKIHYLVTHWVPVFLKEDIKEDLLKVHRCRGPYERKIKEMDKGIEI